MYTKDVISGEPKLSLTNRSLKAISSVHALRKVSRTYRDCASENQRTAWNSRTAMVASRFDAGGLLVETKAGYTFKTAQPENHIAEKS